MFPAEFTGSRFGAGFDDVALPLPKPAAGGGFASAIGAARADIVNTIEQGFGSTRSASQSGWAAAQLTQHLAAFSDAQVMARTSPVAASSTATLDTTRRAFVDEIAPWAEQAAKALGTSPNVIAAHAALESGWGQRPLKTPEGTTTHNLFGIKAGAGWKGATVDASTTEYLNGADMKITDRFRAYQDYDSAFRDYTRLLQDNPRYEAALNAGDDARAFGRALSRGGYATDAAYAEKLAGVANQIQSMNRTRPQRTALDTTGVVSGSGALR